MKFNSYAQAENFLFNTLPDFSKQGQVGYKPGLQRIQILCNHLGNPQNSFKSIHIGGTNGKGSVSHMLYGTALKQKISVGMYTSPHLFHFNERIKVNNQSVEKEFIVDFLNSISPLFETVKPSFFEVTVAMALAYFKVKKVKLAIIEVGMGGELDSTNIINPILSIITNISLDHVDVLGNTFVEISKAKAGIIKFNTPVIIGESNPECDYIFKNIANQNNADIYFADELYKVQHAIHKESRQLLEIHSVEENQIIEIETDMLGIFQQKNIVTALCACTILDNLFPNWKTNFLYTLPNMTITANLKGRWQKLQEEPAVYIDVCHNPAGITQLLNSIHLLNANQKYLIIGLSGDKDLNAIFNLLPIRYHYIFTAAKSNRAASLDRLKNLALQYNLDFELEPNVIDAYKKALSIASKNDVVIVAGSFYMLSELRDIIQH